MDKQYRGEDDNEQPGEESKGSRLFLPSSTFGNSPAPAMALPPRRHSFHSVPVTDPDLNEEILGAQLMNERFHRIFRLPSEENLI